MNVGNGGAFPVIYVNRFLKIAEMARMEDEEVLEVFRKIIKKATTGEYKDKREFINKQYEKMKKNIREYVRIGLRDVKDDDIVSYPFTNDTQKYLFAAIEENEEKFGKIDLTKEMFEKGIFGMTETELWRIAEENMAKEAYIEHFIDTVKELIGIVPEDEFTKYAYVVTNKHRTMGAGAIASRKVLKKLKETLGTNNMVVLPMSIDSVMVFPAIQPVIDNMKFIEHALKKCGEEDLDEWQRINNKAYVMMLPKEF